MTNKEYDSAIRQARADQRRKDCAAVCSHCEENKPERVPFDNTPGEFTWVHHYEARLSGKVIKQDAPCKSAAIHELHHQETTK